MFLLNSRAWAAPSISIPRRPLAEGSYFNLTPAFFVSDSYAINISLNLVSFFLHTTTPRIPTNIATCLDKELSTISSVSRQTRQSYMINTRFLRFLHREEDIALGDSAEYTTLNEIFTDRLVPLPLIEVSRIYVPLREPTRTLPCGGLCEFAIPCPR
jgi:hypothetical protein